MGSSRSKAWQHTAPSGTPASSKAWQHTPPSGTPASYMLTHCGSHACAFLSSWVYYTRSNVELQWPQWGSFELPKLAFLRNKLGELGCVVQPSEWDAFFKWYLEASSRAQHAEVASLQGTISQLADANRQLRKDIKDLEAKVHCSLERPPPSSCTTSASEPSDDMAKPKASCVPWTKDELRTIVRAFPKVTEDPQRFADEFSVIIRVYQPNVTHLLQLVRMLVDESQAKHWMAKANWAHLELNSQQQTPQSPSQAQSLARSLHRAILEAFPKRADWNKIYACVQEPNEPVYQYYIRFELVFKENSALPVSSVSYSPLFNSAFVGNLTPELSLLVKRSSMEWLTMSTECLVGQVSKLARSLEYTNAQKSADTLSHLLQQLKAPQRVPPGLCHYCKKPGHWKKDCYKLKRAKQALPQNPQFWVMDVFSESGPRGITGAPVSPRLSWVESSDSE